MSPRSIKSLKICAARTACLLLCGGLVFALAACSTSRKVASYHPQFTPVPVRILSASDAIHASAPVVLARLQNQKLALMARDETGSMQPFYVRGIETGFYDTRNRKDIDWDQVFAGYQSMGANTAMFMVHWKDIEPQPGKYDFAFMDRIVQVAKKHDVKIWWVLFMRCSIGDPVSGADAWVYRFLNKDGTDHAIQWITRDGKLLNTADAYLKAKTRIYPEYSHPEVFAHIQGILRALGRHYRNSPDVLGVQIGNEEGFNDAGEGDFNPAAIALFNQWKIKTGNNDEKQFRMEINKYWWQNFTTTFHRADPYKLTSYNLLGGGPEAGDERLINRMGVDASIYSGGNLDVIGTMFYGKNGSRIWPNLDRLYPNYTFSLPILVPSEIGLGQRWGPRVQFQQYAIDALERGAQGFSAYCYGELVDTNGQLNAFGITFKKFSSMVRANEDIIYEGVPGPGDLFMKTSAAGAKISQLHRDADATLGILHFPNAYLQPKPDANTNATDVTVQFITSNSRRCKIDVYRDGALRSSTIHPLVAGPSNLTLSLPDVKQTEAVFLRATLLHD